METVDLIAHLNEGMDPGQLRQSDSDRRAAAHIVATENIRADEIVVYWGDVIRFRDGHWSQRSDACEGGYAGCQGSGTEQVDPYDADVNDTTVVTFLCDHCHRERCDDI